MNPTERSRFEHPISVDHTLLSVSTPLLNSIDHEYLHSAGGPYRTPRVSRRASPYGSPVRSPPSSPSDHLDTPPRAYDSDSDRVSTSSTPYPVRLGRILAYDSDDDLPVKRTAHRPSVNTPTTHVPATSTSPFLHSRTVYAYESDDSQQQARKTVSFAQVQDSTQVNTVNTRDAGHSARASGSAQVTISTPLSSGSSTSTPAVTGGPKKETAPKPPLFLESDSDDSDDDDKIPKPTGEAGRPGRGGYSLRAALKWSDEKHGKVKRYINRIVQDKLDCTIPYTEQPLLALKQVRDLAAAKYPVLNQYRDNWATDDFIRAQLKYRKSALQKEAVETELAEIRSRATKSTKRSGKHRD
ncbi:hypothetical protein EV360DRAFT_90432 [Lentinula raphanica]|nr:hypothetical protein EV360DRAFT_90432 [Lentinula raphanica]